MQMQIPLCEDGLTAPGALLVFEIEPAVEDCRWIVGQIIKLMKVFVRHTPYQKHAGVSYESKPPKAKLSSVGAGETASGA